MVTIKSGALDDGIALVEVFSTAGKIASGFWDTHASAFWLTPAGGKEMVFEDRAAIQAYFMVAQ